MSVSVSHRRMIRLVESGLMLAAATVLSMVKLLSLPYGGSVTACSMLPILLVAYRHGTVWGLVTAFSHSLLQLILDAGILSYATSPLAAVAIVTLDYLLAFTVLGLGGVFRRPGRPQGRALTGGALLACGIRYVLHTVGGCTVWAGLSIPTAAAFWYSLGYNATYMIPETAVTVLGAWYLSRSLSLESERPSRAPAPAKTGGVLNRLAALAIGVAGVTDLLLIFRCLQDGETGSFDITGLSRVNWTAVAIVTFAGLAVAAVLWLVGKKARKN